MGYHLRANCCYCDQRPLSDDAVLCNALHAPMDVIQNVLVAMIEPLGCPWMGYPYHEQVYASFGLLSLATCLLFGI